LRDEHASRTAELVCFCRALDQHRAPAERLVDDPYAARFLTPGLRLALGAVAASGRVGRWAEEVLAPRVPGLEGVASALAPPIVTYILVRHRFIDDALLAALARGVEQVVLLGAGYDARAERFREALAGRPVFELDFPSTSRRKARLLGREAEGVLRVEVDFRREGPAEALARTSFSPKRPTFFIWEGVSMYLPRRTVQDTLRQVRGLAAPGSELAMDFWYLLDAPDLVATAHRMTPNLLYAFGEPIVFGIHPEDLPAFAARLEVEAVEVADAAALTARYIRDGREVYPAVYVARLGFDARPPA
jgi:methyltransferase (TIGR00027 family)